MSDAGSNNFVALGVRVGALLLVYAALTVWWNAAATLPARAFDQPAIVVELARGLTAWQWLMALAVVAIVVGRPATCAGWSALEDGNLLRLVVGGLAVVLGVWFASYDFNAYFNQPHALDRALVLALALLTLWRPVFVLPLLAVLAPVSHQFDLPIGGFSLAQQLPAIRILTVFAAFVLLRGAVGRQRSSDFVFVAICAVASFYLEPGQTKMRMLWPLRDQLNGLVFATYANGWLGFLDLAVVEQLGALLGSMNAVGIALTLFVECGAWLCFIRRRYMMAWLSVAILFHVGVFATSGIFFWKWIGLDAVLLALLWLRPRAPSLAIFSRPHFALSLLLIPAGLLLYRPVNLSWYDTPVGYTFRFEAVGASGRHYPLPPLYFSPYDYQFTLGNFTYLLDQPNLQIVWGTTRNLEVAEALWRAKSPQDVFDAEARVGHDTFNAAQSRTFDAFIRDFVTNATARGSRESRAGLLPFQILPRQLWTWPLNAPDIAEPIVEVHVIFVTSWFDGQRYREIRSQLARVIPLA